MVKQVWKTTNKDKIHDLTVMKLIFMWSEGKLSSYQAALQAAIVVIISISIADSEKADRVAQELFQKSSIKQINKQETVIRNSRNVTVTTTDTDIAVNVQILLQILLALLVKLNIL